MEPVLALCKNSLHRQPPARSCWDTAARQSQNNCFLACPPQIARDKTDVSPPPTSESAVSTAKEVGQATTPSSTHSAGLHKKIAQRRCTLDQGHKASWPEPGFEPGSTWELPKPCRMGYGFVSPTRGTSPHPGPGSPSHTSLHSSLRSSPSARYCHRRRRCYCCCCCFCGRCCLLPLAAPPASRPARGAAPPPSPTPPSILSRELARGTTPVLDAPAHSSPPSPHASPCHVAPYLRPAIGPTHHPLGVPPLPQPPIRGGGVADLTRRGRSRDSNSSVGKAG